MLEQEKYQPSIEQVIEANFGKEALEIAASRSKGIFEMIKQELAEIASSEGTSTERKQRADEYLEMWRQFNNSLFARTASENQRSPETVKIAIEGANALMAVKPIEENDEPARKMVEALERDYRIR